MTEKEGGPPQRRLGALGELAHLDASAWRDWLRHGVAVWSLHSSGPELVGAFAPIVLDPREPGPPQIADTLRQLRLGREATRLFEEALAGEIAAWSFADGTDLACFLLELAAWFGCGRIETAIRAMLSRQIACPPRDAERLADSLAFVLCRRTTPNVALSLGKRMRERELLSKPALVQLVAYVATEDASSLPQLLEQLLPEWRTSPSSAPWARMLADQLVDRLGTETVVRTLLAPAATPSMPEASLGVSSVFLQRVVENRFSIEQYRPYGLIVVTDKLRKTSLWLQRSSSQFPSASDGKDYLNRCFEVNAIGNLGLDQPMVMQ
jgi:hypothetical protein